MNTARLNQSRLEIAKIILSKNLPLICFSHSITTLRRVIENYEISSLTYWTFFYVLHLGHGLDV